MLSLLLRVVAWVRSNGLIALTVVLATIVIWWSILFYRFVDEMLSIAQRGYFISTPKLPDAILKRLEKEARHRLSKELE